MRKICDIDVQPLLDVLDESDWYTQHTTERQQKYKVHSQVLTIPLMSGNNAVEAPIDEVSPKTEFFDKYYIPEVFDTLRDVLKRDLGDGFYLRIIMANLPSGASIPTHPDIGRSLLENARIHVPLITHPDVTFTVDGIAYHPEVGGVYELDNRLRHGVVNNSPINRVHIIADWHVA